MNSASLERGGCPFPGLRPYAFEESHLFFGRDKQIADLLQRLGRSRFLAVVGPSGGGKSSLVRAGLRPAILGGLMTGSVANWQVVEMRPGIDPVLALKAAVKTTLGPIDVGIIDSSQSLTEWAVAGGIATSKGLLVIADQFEEVFRISEPESARLFVEMLLSATEQTIPIYVVLTMRHDYLGDCSRFGGLPEALNRSQYLMPSLTRQQRHEAILGPLNIAGVTMSPQLQQLLLSHSGAGNWSGVGDSLPVLQHTLFRTFQEWKRQGQGKEITIDHYMDCGGLDRALDMHATEVLQSLPTDARRIAPPVFRCLTVADKGRFVRRPMRLDAITKVCGDVSGDLVLAVVRAFSAEHNSLVSFRPALGADGRGEGWVDIMHESLITHWKSLADWCQEEADDAASYQELCRAAAAWAGSRHKGDLLHENKLISAEAALSSGKYNREWGSLYGKSADFDQVSDFVARSVQRRRQLRIQLGLAAVGVLLSLGLVLWQLQKARGELTWKDQEIALGERRVQVLEQRLTALEASTVPSTDEGRLNKTIEELTIKLELANLRVASLERTLGGQLPADQARLVPSLQRQVEDARARLIVAQGQLEEERRSSVNALKQKDVENANALKQKNVEIEERERRIDALERAAVASSPAPASRTHTAVICPILSKTKPPTPWFEHYEVATRSGTDRGLAISHILAAIAAKTGSGPNQPRLTVGGTGAGGTVDYFPYLELAKLTRDLSDAELAACLKRP